ISSIHDLVENAKFLSSLGGKPGDAKKIDDGIKKVLPNGLKGIDTSKPLAVYGMLDPGGNPMDSTAVALVPVTDEKSFLGLLSDFHLEAKKEGDLYSVTHDRIPVPGYIRFSDGYALITAKEKDAISKGKVLPLSRVFSSGKTGTISVDFR